MTKRFWVSLLWTAVAVVAALLVLDWGLRAWADHELRSVKRDLGDYRQALFSQDEFAAGEVNGSHIIDVAIALTAVADSEGEFSPSWSALRELVRQYQDVEKAAMEGNLEKVVHFGMQVRALPVIGRLQEDAESHLVAGDLDEYLAIVGDQLTLAEWMSRETNSMLSRQLGLAGAAQALRFVLRDTPFTLALAPDSFHQRVRRLAALGVQDAVENERALLTLVAYDSGWPQDTRDAGWFDRSLYRLRLAFSFPRRAVRRAERLSEWANMVAVPPYRRDSSDSPTQDDLVSYVVNVTDEMEVALLQVQLASAAADYLRICRDQGQCPQAPSMDIDGLILDVDPYSGGPWKWTEKDGACVFYSVGLGGYDDGGKLLGPDERLRRPGRDVGWTLPCGGQKPDLSF